MDADNQEDREDKAPAAPRNEGVRIIGADEAAAALEAGQAAGRRPDDAPRFGDVPEAPAAGPTPAARFPLPDAVDPSQLPRAPLAGAGSSGAEMPHWTEPATGEVPAILSSASGAGAGREEDDDMAAWSGFAGGARWRDQPRDWDDAGFEDDLEPDQMVAGSVVPDPDDPFGYEYDLDDEPEEAPAPAPVARGRSGGGRLWGRVAGRSRTARPAGRRGQPAPEDVLTDPSPEPLLVDEDDVWEDPELPLPVGATQVMTPTGEVRISSRQVGPLGAGAGPGPGPAGSEPGRRGGGPASVGVRVATGVGIGLLLVLVAQFGPVPLLALCALAVLLAAIEGYSALRRAGYRPATLLGLTGTVSLMVGAYLKGETALPLVAVLTMVFALIWYLAGVVRARPVMNIGASMVMFMWVGFLASFAGLLLDPTQFPHRHGVAFLMAAVIAAVGYDVGGFAFGRRLGRRPLAPSISPNKTWEGLVGGMLTSLVVTSVVVSQISPWSLKDAIALGVVGAVVAPVGDLCQSMVKRDLEVKDMGAVLPGHGGMLDRIDAILFVLPATYYLVRVLGIG
ncbi:MAG TPA: phosphatidate cytidylyltransferase [Acidimicrobiales bacterium]|nr:phosphatidate cytidylyltransferase [Acidimicrobiales bacterium]